MDELLEAALALSVLPLDVSKARLHRAPSVPERNPVAEHGGERTGEREGVGEREGMGGRNSACGARVGFVERSMHQMRKQRVSTRARYAPSATAIAVRDAEGDPEGRGPMLSS